MEFLRLRTPYSGRIIKKLVTAILHKNPHIIIFTYKNCNYYHALGPKTIKKSLGSIIEIGAPENIPENFFHICHNIFGENVVFLR